jgi:Propanediol utilization protein
MNEIGKDSKLINVGVSNRHVHLSEKDKKLLFGKDYKLIYVKALSQKGQFAAKEGVTLVGPKGSIENVRILGPERKRTQIEISRTDMYKLGINAPVRESGDVDGTPGVILIGPRGMVQVQEGVICAKRHIHMNLEDSERLRLKDGVQVMVKANNERGLVFDNVLVRVNENFTLELHIDMDEANAAWLSNNDSVEIM